MLQRCCWLILFTLALVACSQDKAVANVSGSAAGAVAADAAAAPATTVAGDAEKGKRWYIYCQACHTLDAGGDNRVGPNLHGVVGRAAGQAEGFIYSDALTNSGIVWDAAALDKWLAAPAEMVPGTMMAFAGVTDAQQRADLVAYLTQAAGSE